MTAPTPKSWVQSLDAYVPGRSKADGKALTKLSANEAPFGPSEKALVAFREAAGDLRHYPDGGAHDLREAIARRHAIDADQIVCGAGSDEVLHLIGQAYVGPGDEVIHSLYGFAMYPIIAKALGGTPVAVPNKDYAPDVDGILAAITDNTRVIYLDNPNNPTGACLPESEVRRLHAGVPEDVILVLDAAYAESVTMADYEAGAALVREFSNVVMTRTFSKMYALAALRLGWAYAPPAVVDVLNRIRLPFNVSVPASAAAIAALDDQDFLQSLVDHNARWRDRLTAAFSALGLHVVPSETNFVLVRFPDEQPFTAEAVDRFLADHGILIRRLGFLPGHVRITIGSEQENNALMELVAMFMSGQRA